MMLERARLLGLKVCDVPAFGDCLPDAISRAINIRNNDTELTPKTVREDCVAWLRQNPSFLYLGEPISRFLDDERDESWEVSCL